SGTITFDPEALGLSSVSLDVSDARTRQKVPATRISGEKIQWRVNLPPAGFQVVRIGFARPTAELRGERGLERQR
ncbi:MAG: hypothetical protein ACRD3O_17525, partial [Terriglobia bacterium]